MILRLRTNSLFFGALTAALVAACGDSAGTDGGARPDATVAADAPGPVDLGTPDTGAADTGAADTGPADTGVVDTGVVDTGTPDTGPADTGAGPAEPRIPGLSAPVTVNFDAYGITHLRCATDADCFAAEGYYHAAHRFAQMDLRRRFVRGRIAELFGPLSSATVNQDFSSRLFLATPDGQDLAAQMLAAASPASRAMLDAYTRGVNAWIADFKNGRNGARLSEEWASAATLITDWEPADSIAGVIALVASLTDSTGDDIDRGRLAGAVSTEEFFDLYGLLPISRAAQLDSTRALRTGPQVDPALMARIRELQGSFALADRALERARANLPVKSGLITPGFGSNNWVVSPRLAQDGRSAYLGNDPHLGMTNPATWYLVEMDAKTSGTGRIHVAGASFAGLPGIILGQNENTAWGATTTYFDQADVYVETLAQDGSGVVRNGQTVPFVRRNYAINQLNFAGGYDVVNREALYVPGHGPVLSVDTAANVAVSARWVGHNLSTDINFVWDIMVSATEAEARQAFRNSTSLGQNFVVIDRQGDIGWYPYNNLPSRPWAAMQPPWLPLFGSGQYEWMGYLREDQLPQARNPVGGFVATANADMNGALYDGNPLNDGLVYLQSGADPGWRQERIVERLTQGTGQHNLASMESIQNDVVSLAGRNVTPELLRATASATGQLTPAGVAVRQALAAWAGFSCPTGLASIEPTSAPSPDATQTTESAGCFAFHAVIGQLHRRIFADEMARRGVTERPNLATLFVQILTPNRLANSAGYWDDVSTAGVVETDTQAYVRALNDAGTWLQAQLGATADTWRWGRRHTVTLRADLFSSAGLTSFDSPAYAAQGGLWTVNVANPGGLSNDSYTFGSGPSMRFSCEANSTRPVRCTIDLPGGQRHFKSDTHYSDLMREHWLPGVRVPLAFVAGEVMQATVATETVRPPQ